MKKLTILLACLLALAAVAGATRAGDAPAAAGDSTDGITVQGSASASGVPNRAQLSFGVESQGATAKAALAANSVEMRNAIAAVKAAGGTSVQTQSVTLSPRYNENSVVQGFSATNTVTATVLDLAKAGALIDAAVDAGANQVYGPSLSISDQDELYKKALKGAVVDARAKAQALAAAANLSLGKITAIVEGGGSGPILLDAAKSSAEGSTPIEAGQQQTTATIMVTFSVQ